METCHSKAPLAISTFPVAELRSSQGGPAGHPGWLTLSQMSPPGSPTCLKAMNCSGLPRQTVLPRARSLCSERLMPGYLKGHGPLVPQRAPAPSPRNFPCLLETHGHFQSQLCLMRTPILKGGAEEPDSPSVPHCLVPHFHQATQIPRDVLTVPMRSRPPVNEMKEQSGPA